MTINLCHYKVSLIIMFTDSWTKVVNWSVVEFDSLVHKTSSSCLLVLSVLDHFIHGDVGLGR